jgi:nitroimidazol reductase NimA-like FMN-containing flavoprotein (pyridoxamine 5'-phosphate oxidase superfamily)
MAIVAEDLCGIADALLRENRYMTLATAAADGQPWIAPLMFAFDRDDGFIWPSALDAVHSLQLRENPLAAAVVFDSQPEYGKAQALYCRGRAIELSGDQLEIACSVFYARRYPDPAERSQKSRGASAFLGDSPRRLYRIQIDQYSLLHPDKHPVHGGLVDHRVTIEYSASRLFL